MLGHPTRLPRAARHVITRCTVAAILLVPSLVARGQSAGTIPWRRSYERAAAEALATGRPLLLQFTGRWCTFCRKMEAEVFSRADVARRAREAFVPVAIDTDERDDLTERFAIEALPTTILVSPAGKELARNEGYAEPAEFLAFLDAARPASSSKPLSDDIALAGYCPVSLVEGRGLRPGQPGLAARHDGRVYRFADSARRESFLRDPEAYLPANGGRCVVRQVLRGESVPGDPRYGVYYQGRLYLCADEDARQRFARAPERFADADVADQGNCPHCWQQTGRKVRGVPQFSAVRGGRRYLFPDLSHLEAFQAAPDQHLR